MGHPWTWQETQRLRDKVLEEGPGDWESKQGLFPGRTSKSLATRWERIRPHPNNKTTKRRVRLCMRNKPITAVTLEINREKRNELTRGQKRCDVCSRKHFSATRICPCGHIMIQSKLNRPAVADDGKKDGSGVRETTTEVVECTTGESGEKQDARGNKVEDAAEGAPDDGRDDDVQMPFTVLWSPREEDPIPYPQLFLPAEEDHTIVWCN